MITELPGSSVRSAVASEILRLRQQLLEELGPANHWTGELSSSALATAVASIALVQLNGASSADKGDADRIARGIGWLARHANPDGGWGDTIHSRSNISTTALCWAAFGAAQADG